VRAPLSWLREFVPGLDASPREIAEAFDNLGFEVEALESPGEEIVGVVVARILDVLPHPNADKLQLADVDYGSDTTRVVCGAPNIAAGMVVPFAPSGASLPGGFKLEKRKIRGEVSDGMLCSAKELGLGDDHSGILALDPDATLGSDVRDTLGLNDTVFDLGITPNRPDAMSIIGLARELAARFNLELVVPIPLDTGDTGTGLPSATVEIEDGDRCPRYLARVASVTLGPSPEWLAQRLRLAGVRAISNVVDVTNYVLLERGQPLHAFDVAKLAGPGVIVRRATDGETMVTLDGVSRTLTGEDLLICDVASTPQAIAGIMGGSTAEVSETTTSILLESAAFQAMGISKSSKRLGVRSESSARFERGVDPHGVESAADRALELLIQIANAKVSDLEVDVISRPTEPETIRVHTARVNALLGTDLDDAAVTSALAPLGLLVTTEDDGVASVTVPTYRPDLTREVDLIEEVARRVGLNQIPRTLPDTTGHVGGLTPRQRDRRLIADVLVGLGASEATAVSLIAPAEAAPFGFATDALVYAANPLRAEDSVLRPRLLPGLLRAVALNAAHGRGSVALFELGHTFLPSVSDRTLPDERDHVALVVAGSVTRSPIEPDRLVDVYDAVDAVRALIDALELADARIEAAAEPGFHPTRCAALIVDDGVAGYVGELAPAVTKQFEVPGVAVAFELDIDALVNGRRRDRQFRDLSRFPASSVDLAFVAPITVPAAAIEATLRTALGADLESVRCFDEFAGGSLAEGTRSLAFALRFRSLEQTFTDAEVAARRQGAIDAVTKAHGAALRG
jgi:phenylalanyl-tRNA synthetase beta chain